MAIALKLLRRFLLEIDEKHRSSPHEAGSTQTMKTREPRGPLRSSACGPREGGSKRIELAGKCGCRFSYVGAGGR